MSIKKSVIDWQRSIELANNKSELAQMILAMFVEELPIAKKEIVSNRNNPEELYPRVHHLLGSACSCGVPNITETTKQLEIALKRAADQKQISSLIAQLESDIDDVLQAYKRENYS